MGKTEVFFVLQTRGVFFFFVCFLHRDVIMEGVVHIILFVKLCISIMET